MDAERHAIRNTDSFLMFEFDLCACARLVADSRIGPTDFVVTSQPELNRTKILNCVR